MLSDLRRVGGYPCALPSGPDGGDVRHHISWRSVAVDHVIDEAAFEVLADDRLVPVGHDEQNHTKPALRI
jgi:hypothetical protein